MLAGCSGEDSALTEIDPAETESTLVPEPPAAEETESESTALPDITTPTLPAAEEEWDLDTIDPTLEDIDNRLCEEALETRAELEELLLQGQDVGDLIAAIDELITELDGCSLTPTPEE